MTNKALVKNNSGKSNRISLQPVDTSDLKCLELIQLCGELYSRFHVKLDMEVFRKNIVSGSGDCCGTDSDETILMNLIPIISVYKHNEDSNRYVFIIKVESFKEYLKAVCGVVLTKEGLYELANRVLTSVACQYGLETTIKPKGESVERYSIVTLSAVQGLFPVA